MNAFYKSASNSLPRARSIHPDLEAFNKNPYFSLFREQHSYAFFREIYTSKLISQLKALCRSPGLIERLVAFENLKRIHAQRFNELLRMVRIKSTDPCLKLDEIGNSVSDLALNSKGTINHT